MIEESKAYESLWKEYYKTCNHICDACPFANECTHYEPTMSGMIE